MPVGLQRNCQISPVKLHARARQTFDEPRTAEAMNELYVFDPDFCSAGEKVASKLSVLVTGGSVRSGQMSG